MVPHECAAQGVGRQMVSPEKGFTKKHSPSAPVQEQGGVRQ
jgi:hypothetical protein